MKSYFSLADLNDETLGLVLDLARRGERGELDPHLLKGRMLALVFASPSLRTLASMQVAMADLGGRSFLIEPGRGSWGLAFADGVPMNGAEAEHVREAVPVLESYADALAVRWFAEGKNLSIDLADGRMRRLSELAKKPFINLESASRHPCQALADLKTCADFGLKRGDRFVLSWAPHPRPLPLAVPISTLHMAARAGYEVVVHRPEGFGLPERVMAEAATLAMQSGGTVTETDDHREAMSGARVLYAKSWQAPMHYGNASADAQLREKFSEGTVRASWFDDAHRDARFLHCLPLRRNVIVEDAVLDGPRSAVITQAENRLHVQRALLAHLLGDMS